MVKKLIKINFIKTLMEDNVKELICLRCNNKMKYSGQKKIQLGETGWILGDLPNLLAGSMNVE